MKDRKKVVRMQKIALVLGALLIIAAVFLWKRFMPSMKKMTPEEYFGTPASQEAFVIADDSILDTTAVLSGDRYYLPYTTVHSILNPRFYLDPSLGKILYTNAAALFTLEEESTAYYEGDTVRDAGYPVVRTIKDELYLSLDFVQAHSDFTFAFYEEPDRFVITRGSVESVTATARYSVRVRYGAGSKYPIITTAARDDSLVILEDFDKWKKVKTADGYIGYVPGRSLGEAVTLMQSSVSTEPAYTSLSVDDPLLTLVWHEIDYAEMNEGLLDDISGMSGIHVISPTWYFLTDNSGQVGSFASRKYIAEAEKKGLEVWPLIRNFGEGVDTSAVLASRSARKNVQDFLISEAKELGFTGLNIDFEGIPESAGDDYVQFMREMSILCRKEEIFLTVDVPVPMPYSYYYDRQELGVVCDYVIMMGYDEHYAGSDLAGSVASMDFERNGIQDMLKEVPAEKVISAIPFYCRLWYTGTDEDGNTVVTSEGVAMKNAWSTAEENGAVAVWDEEAEQPYAEWTDEAGRYCQLWLEDDSTAKARASLVAEYQIGGLAAWVLTQQTDTVWESIQTGLGQSLETVPKIPEEETETGDAPMPEKETAAHDTKIPEETENESSGILY